MNIKNVLMHIFVCRDVEHCHFTYVTKFTPSQEKVCADNYKKICHISFKQEAGNETVQRCSSPVYKVCDGQGPEECVTSYQSSCSTKTVERQPGQVTRETACQKLPVEICGAGCSFEEGAEECYDDVVASVVEIPEEVCDINPEKICRFSTKLVPSLSPENQCTIVPKETCQLSFSSPTPSKKTLLTKWCLDEPEQPTYRGATSNSLDEASLTKDDVPAATAPQVPKLKR